MAAKAAALRHQAGAPHRTVSAPARRAAPAHPVPAARALQRRLGNQGTQVFAAQALARAAEPAATAPASLAVSQPGDPHEREAERVADAVMALSAASLHDGIRAPLSSASEARIDRQVSPGAATPAIVAAVQSPDGHGSPLPAATRAFFEPRFGADFSRVRVDSGAAADAAARALGARAFTVGSRISFAAGQYAPATRDGQHLLAHELTHVVQGGHGAPAVMRAPAPPFMRAAPPPQQGKPPPGPAAVEAARSEVVELQGHPHFDPSPALAEMIDWWSPGSLSVQVRFGALASGRIDVRRDSAGYATTGNPALINLHHPAFPGAGYMAPPRMQLTIAGGVVAGHVQFFPWDRVDAAAILAWVDAYPVARLLGWKGIDRVRFPHFTNEVKGGVLRYAMDSFEYRLDREWTGTGTFRVTDDQVTFSAETDIRVPGLANAKMVLEWASGKVFGSTRMALTLAPKDILGGVFSGGLEGSFAGGETNITGTASYRSNKLNGTVTLRVAPVREAQAQVAARMPAGSAPAPAALPPGARHAVFGWGMLDFHYNAWLSGRAEVVVDPQGYITSFGNIRPIKEFTFLTEERYGKSVPIGKASASAFAPVWLTTGVTGSIDGELWAEGRLGPLTLHDLEMSGVYSTNPAIPLQATLTGVADVSAIGRLRLKLTGALAYTLVGKYGETAKIAVNVVGTGTVKAYSLLKPSFLLEKAKDADAQFRIKASFKVAAGFYLGLQGSIKASVFGAGPTFKSDKYQWYLGGVGLKSELDHIIGDSLTPTLTFDDYTFDPALFKKQAEALLDNQAEKADKKQQAGQVRDDKTTRARALPKGPPVMVPFDMNGAQHVLWIEAEPVPTLYMASRGKPLNRKLRAAEAGLEKDEKAADGAQKALIRAEETALAALLTQTIEVESTAASLEQRQADVTGLRELARRIGIYSRQFTRKDIGDRTDVMDTDAKALLPGEGLVGTFAMLRDAGHKGDELTPHHMPQDKYMEYKLKADPGGESWSRDEGICMNMYHPLGRVKKGRHFFTRSYGGFGNPPRYKETPMEALQKDIANARAIYEKDGLLDSRIQHALALVHALNVKNYPKLFRGTP